MPATSPARSGVVRRTRVAHCHSRVGEVTPKSPPPGPLFHRASVESVEVVSGTPGGPSRPANWSHSAMGSGIHGNSFSPLGVVNSKGTLYYRYARGSSSRSRYTTHLSSYHAGSCSGLGPSPPSPPRRAWGRVCRGVSGPNMKSYSRVYRAARIPRCGRHPSRSYYRALGGCFRYRCLSNAKYGGLLQTWSLTANNLSRSRS